MGNSCGLREWSEKVSFLGGFKWEGDESFCLGTWPISDPVRKYVIQVTTNISSYVLLRLNCSAGANPIQSIAFRYVIFIWDEPIYIYRLSFFLLTVPARWLRQCLSFLVYQYSFVLILIPHLSSLTAMAKYNNDNHLKFCPDRRLLDYFGRYSPRCAAIRRTQYWPTTCVHNQGRNSVVQSQNLHLMPLCVYDFSTICNLDHKPHEPVAELAHHLRQTLHC